jgi:predicted nuclease with TOPRIM domain
MEGGMSDQYDGPLMAQYLIKLQAKADALQKTIDEKRDQCQEIIKLRDEVERLRAENEKSRDTLARARVISAKLNERLERIDAGLRGKGGRDE